jgi:hypothetical protein
VIWRFERSGFILKGSRKQRIYSLREKNFLGFSSSLKVRIFTLSRFDAARVTGQLGESIG